MTSQFGSKIISHFNDSSRGANEGKNDHGIEVTFILVSTEVDTFWDPSVESLRQQNGFEIAAIDSAPNRASNIRQAWSHYRGVASTPPPSNLPFGERRRMVILNTLPSAEGYSDREVLYNSLPQSSGALSGADEAGLKAAINSIEPGVVLPDNDGDGDPDATDPDDDNDGLLDSDEAILGLDPFSADSDNNGTDDGDENADGDEYTNAEELNLLLTDPLDGGSRFVPQFAEAGNNHSISFPTLVGRRYGVLSSADLGQFNEVASRLGNGAVQTIDLGPLMGTGFYRVQIEFAP